MIQITLNNPEIENFILQEVSQKQIDIENYIIELLKMKIDKNNEIDELEKLFSASNNKITATKEKAINTEEMINDIS